MKEIVSLQKVVVDRSGRQRILDIDEFSIQKGELVALVGPNGAGKSTLLQTINLLHPYEGKIRLFGDEVNKSDPDILRRRSAMVFQETLLINGTVFENVALPLSFRGFSGQEIKPKVCKALSDLGCDHLAQRSAKLLSGGEAQRVCIARALVTEPELLLLDEPFASLDVAMRSSMIEEIRTVAQNRGITVLMVSHNFSDVLYFAERAVALFDGKILQDGHPEILMRRPVDQNVARLVGMDNILPCIVEQVDEKRYIALAGGIRFLYGGPLAPAAVFCCLPGDLLAPVEGHEDDPVDGRVVIEGHIERIMPGIGTNLVLVRRGELTLNVRLVRNHGANHFHAGQRIRLSFDPDEVHVV